MTVLCYASITLKLRKSEFFTVTVKYLDHIIRAGRLMIENVRIKSCTEAEEPRTQTKLRSFFGLDSVYRLIIPSFSDSAAPPIASLRKGLPLKLSSFTTDQTAAFRYMIRAVTIAPILSLPKSGLPYSVDTDSSDQQVGCALFQTCRDGECNPTGYCPNTLKVNQRNYSVLDEECLAVVYALSTLRPYLTGLQLIVSTDHSWLRSLMNIGDPSGCLMQWRLRLAEFTFDVIYKRIVETAQADALSRLPTEGEAVRDADENEIPCFVSNGSIPEAPHGASDEASSGNIDELRASYDA